MRIPAIPATRRNLTRYQRMKKTLLLCLAAAALLMLAGCGHNVSQVGLGSAFRLGSGEFSLSYTDGLFLNSVNRENMKFTAELDSTVGAAYDPVTGTYKGIKSISVETGPQITGYTADLAKESPAAVEAYYQALAAYYQAKGKTAGQPAISDEKSKAATLSIADVIKTAIKTAKGIVDGREDEKGEAAIFSCDGNCDYADLTGNPDIAYQLSIAMKLLEYDGDQKRFPDTDERYRTTLEHFITELIAYRARGHKNTPLRVKYVTVEDKIITKLMYAYFPKDEPAREVTCPSCVFMDDNDAD